MPNPTLQRIQREAVEAQQQMDQLRGGQNPDPTPAPAPSATNDDTPPPAPSADNSFGQQQQVTNLNDDDTPPSQSGPISAEAFAALQQQLSTLQGRVESQSQQLAEERGRAQVLQHMLTLKGQNDDTPPPAPRERPKIANPKLIEEYGDELVGLVRDLIREDLQFTVEPLSAQIQAIAANVSQLTNGVRGMNTHIAQTAQATFEEQLNKLVTDAKGNPDWHRIDTMHNSGDSRFVDWLNKPSEDTGEIRKAIIGRLYQQQDAPRVARLINKFKAEYGLPDGTAKDDSANALPNPAAALVSPSPSGSSTPAGSSRGRPRTFKMSEINAHYDDKTKGKWAGKEAEWKKQAVEMDKAVSEGRVEYDIR